MHQELRRSKSPSPQRKGSPPHFHHSRDSKPDSRDPERRESRERSRSPIQRRSLSPRRTPHSPGSSTGERPQSHENQRPASHGGAPTTTTPTSSPHHLPPQLPVTSAPPHMGHPTYLPPLPTAHPRPPSIHDHTAGDKIVLDMECGPDGGDSDDGRESPLVEVDIMSHGDDKKDLMGNKLSEYYNLLLHVTHYFLES